MACVIFPAVLMATLGSLANPYPITSEWLSGITRYDTWMIKERPPSKTTDVVWITLIATPFSEFSKLVQFFYKKTINSDIKDLHYQIES